MYIYIYTNIYIYIYIYMSPASPKRKIRRLRRPGRGLLRGEGEVVDAQILLQRGPVSSEGPLIAQTPGASKKAVDPLLGVPIKSPQ